MFQAFQQRRWSLIILWVLIVAAIVAAPAVLPVFRLNLLGRFLSLAIVALGIDLIWGFTGLLSLGQGIFFALGGYVAAMYLQLNSSADLPNGIYERAKNFKIRGSSGKVNIALSGMPKFTHVPDNRYINRGGQGFTGSMETMERAYDCWKRGRWSDDPFIEAVIPSAWDPTVAPPGCHWMSTFIQYCPPKLADGEWTPEKRDAFGATVIDKIERYAPGFKDLVVHAEVRTPHEIENEIGLTEGNIFQGELTIDQLLFNRPFPGYGQYRMPLKKMYMCGSSTHPGGGVSSACGANAAREILRDLRKPNTVPEDDFYDE